MAAPEEGLSHVERPWAGTTVCFTLGPEGLLREEATASVTTRREEIPYGDIWDACKVRGFPRVHAAVLLAITLALVSSLLLSRPSPLFVGLSAAALAVAWGLLLARSNAWTVRLFDYDGYELACLHGARGKPFGRFVETLEERVRAQRFAVQGIFESLDLGGCQWEGPLGRWKGTFVYDRVILERRDRLGEESRVYFALSSLEPPVRLAWRVPWPALAGTPLLACGSAALAFESARAGMSALWPWVWGVACACAALAFWGAVRFAVAAEVFAGTVPVRTPWVPWWCIGRLKPVLAWFARLVQLADLLDVLRTEDYWEYHRAKLQILREQGFLEDWPYRSTLGRLNASEREELARE